MWLGKGGGEGLKEKSRKLRWDHLHHSSHIHTTPYTCTEPHTAAPTANWTHTTALIAFFFISVWIWDAFHHPSSISVGVNLALFTGLSFNIGHLIAWTCLARGNWSLLSCLQFSIHLQLTSSQHSQPDWAINLRFWSRGRLSPTNHWGVICSQSHLRRLCSWPHRQSGWGHSQRP